MKTYNNKLVRHFAIAFVALTIVSSSVIAQLSNTLSSTTTSVSGVITSLTSKVKNDSACIKGRLVIEGLKPLGGSNTTRQDKLDKAGNALQSLCSSYTEYALTMNSTDKVTLASTVRQNADNLELYLSDFVNEETQANVEYTPDNYGQLAAASVALKSFNVLLVKQKAYPHDATEDQVLSTVIQSTSLALGYVKRLLATAPEGLFSALEQPKEVAAVEPSAPAVN